MDATYLAGLEGAVMGSWRRRARNNLYRTDPEAWLWDVLGYRWHEKQREIAEKFMNSRRSATKSSNGSGKTRQYAELAMWGVMTHEPGELLIIASSPSSTQLKDGLFGYLDKNINRARSRGFEVPGYLNDSSIWAYRASSTSRARTLMRGRTPPRQDIVGTFQGIRAVSDEDTSTWVFIDEGGAVHDDLYVAAEAVTTGAGDNKIAVIGNPDRIGTHFQRIFEDEDVRRDWETITISAFDLPTFTGEQVYSDPEMQRKMLESGMIDPEWVETARRQWGEDSARFRSKALGEFPDGDDWSFFSQVAINAAEETEIEPANEFDKVLGVDLADGGNDDSKAYLNHSGRIRHHSTWNEGAESPNRIHEAAMSTEAGIVVMDRLGVGGGPYHTVAARADRFYTVIGAKASERSPDPSRWANARAYWYDMLREGMMTGQVDLDFTEEGPNGEKVGKALKDQLLSVRYDYNNRGAIQIEPKKEARKRGISSPDDLDAVVFAYAVNAKAIVEDPLAGREVGDVVLEDPWYADPFLTTAGMPI